MTGKFLPSLNCCLLVAPMQRNYFSSLSWAVLFDYSIGADQLLLDIVLLVLVCSCNRPLFVM